MAEKITSKTAHNETEEKVVYDELLDEEENEEEDEENDRDDDELKNTNFDMQELIRNHECEIEMSPDYYESRSDGQKKPASTSFRRELGDIFNAMTRGRKLLDADESVVDESKNDEDSDEYLRNHNFEEYKKRMKDISAECGCGASHDGSIFKKILQPGAAESQQAERGKIVKYHYNLTIEDQDEPFDSSLIRGKLQKAKLGDGKLLPGLEIALTTMKEGELADFLISHKYAFGVIGCPPRIPPFATIRATVRLVECTDQDPVEAMDDDKRRRLPPNEIIDYIKRKLDEGKKEFARGKLITAINNYKECLAQLKLAETSYSDNEKQELKALLTRLYKNLAVCYLQIDMAKMKKKAKIYLEKLDKLNKLGGAAMDDAKYYFLWAKVYYVEGEYDKALANLQAARVLEPKNGKIANLLCQVQRAKKEYDQKTKEQVKRMFGEKQADNQET